MKEYIDLSQYGNDTKNRKYYTVAESFCHPAKMSWALTCWIIDNYCDPKKPEVVLDPMAGVGSTLVVGMMRRPQSIWLGVEFEDKFVKLCQANIHKVERIAKENIFMEVGQAICIQGDSRSLEGVVDKIITSPPFAEAQSGGGIAKKGYQDPKHSSIDLVGKRSYMPENIGSKNNISNLKYGQVNKIVMSPPYSEMYRKSNVGTDKDMERRKERLKKAGIDSNNWAHWARQRMGNLTTPQEYSKQKDNLGNFPHGKINNMGEVRGKTYLSEMLRVYQSCYSVLVPNGLMILVLKDFMRKGERIPLGEHTVELCKKAGFAHIRTHYRKIKNPSFWRTLQVQKYGEKYRIDHENILVFKK